jgi:hypothetical protein
VSSRSTLILALSSGGMVRFLLLAVADAEAVVVVVHPAQHAVAVVARFLPRILTLRRTVIRLPRRLRQ